MTRHLFITSIGIVLFGTYIAAADEPASADQIKIVELTLTPAAEPDPALRYRLLPEASQRTAGNGASYYYRALLHQSLLPKDHWKKFNEQGEAWLSASGDDFPKEEVATWLAALNHVHGQARIAAYRETCDWDLRVQDLKGLEPISFLLQDFQECRQLARTLRLKAHYEILDGRPHDALETLRIGYQLARDVCEPPFLINALIGIAVTAHLNEELVFLIDHSDINLYWALASLPHPMIDMRPAMEYEMQLPFQLFPFLKDAETADRTPEEWRRLVADCVASLEELQGSRRDAPLSSDFLAVALAAKVYPQAKEELRAAGFPPDRLEAMPVGQVVAIQTSRSLKHSYQEMFKNMLLPGDEGLRRMPGAIERLKQEGYLGPAMTAKKEGIPLASLLIPAVQGVQAAELRLSRDMAAIQAIEAIRMHAAAGEGKLPLSLEEISVVPVPVNPVTASPFKYSYDTASGSATLDVPSQPNVPQLEARQYRIRMTKAE